MIRRILGNRWVRRIGLTLFLIVLILVIAGLNTFYGLRHRGEQHRDSVIANLDATDPGWRWEQITAAREKNLPPPEENVIEQAVKLRDRFPKEGYGEWAQVPTDTFRREPGRLPSVVELVHAQKLVEVCRELIPEARNLRHLSGGVIVPLAENPIATLLPHVQKPREVAVLLQQDALVSAVDGRPDDALDDALAMLAMGRGLGDEPFLISQLVRMALAAIAARTVERTLWLSEATDAKLAEVQAALEAEAKASRFLPALRGERACMVKLADFLRKDPGQAAGLTSGSQQPPKAVTAVVVSALLPETEARYLEVMNRAIAVAEKPPGPERDEEFAQIERDVKADDSLEGQGVRLLYPAISKCYEADVRTTALLTAAAAAVEAERHRIKTGRYPTDWSFRDAPPTDPFVAQPLRMKATAEGIVIYSVGPDHTDNDGNLPADGSTKQGSDVGLRLLLPPHRRQPPLPRDEQP